MAEDKAKGSPDEAWGNGSKVFSCFVWKAFWFDNAIDTNWWPLILNGYPPYYPYSGHCSLFMDKNACARVPIYFSFARWKMKILVHFYFLFLLKLKTTLATHLSKFIFHENENESFLISQHMKIQNRLIHLSIFQKLKMESFPIHFLINNNKKKKIEILRIQTMKITRNNWTSGRDNLFVFLWLVFFDLC